jgi:hypothetical protein
MKEEDVEMDNLIEFIKKLSNGRPAEIKNEYKIINRDDISNIINVISNRKR